MAYFVQIEFNLKLIKIKVFVSDFLYHLTFGRKTVESVEYWIGLNETNSDVRMYTLIIYFIC